MRVAVAVIPDTSQRFLITRRAMHHSQGGLWEFPGGKLEENESAESALIREIKEEVDLDVLAFEYWGDINYAYSHQPITLVIFHVTAYQGTAICREKQQGLCWATFDELQHFNFPAANIEILKLINQKIFCGVGVVIQPTPTTEPLR